MPSQIWGTGIVPLALTLGIYQLSSWLFQRSGRHPLCNPVLVSICLLICALTLVGMPYERYFQGAQLIHVLLGPAVVALAIPLHRHFIKVKRAPLMILGAIGVGSLAGGLSAAGIAWMCRAETASIVSLVPKSVTAPVAMGISQSIGGIPPLAAVLAVLTGVLGASVGPSLLDRLGVTDAALRGLAMGTASHGIGTARALQESEETGAFSGLAMGLAALAMSIILPFAWRIL